MQTKYAKTLGFCLQILLSGTLRARSLVNYLMSLASGGHLCKHPVDLTPQPHCHYTYSNLTKVVKHFHYTEAILRDFFTAYADPPKVLDSGKNYYTIGYDFTKLIKAYSHSLESRLYVLRSNPVVGKVCVTAGYVLGALHYLSGTGGFAPILCFATMKTKTTLRKGVTTTIMQQSITDLTADDEQTQKYQLQNGKWVIVTLRRYNNLHIRSKQGANSKGKPFDLVMVTLQDTDSGEMVFTRPLFIAITGELKSGVSTWQAYKEYLLRFDVEKTYQQPADERFSDL